MTALLANERDIASERREAVERLSARSWASLAEEDRKLVLRACRDLRAANDPSNLPRIMERVPDAAADLRRLAEALDARARLRADYEAVRGDELEAARRALREAVADEAVREAIGWQSPSASDRIDRLVADGLPVRTSKVRTREQTAAMYLQRYFAKNDTIGYFGPVSCGTVGAGDAALRCESPVALLDRRQVYFEHWAMRALATKVAEDPAVQPFLRPRRSGRIALAGRTLRYPIDRTTELPAPFAALVAAADGTNDRDGLAARLVGENDDQFADGEELEAAIVELEQGAILSRDLPLPTGTFDPEVALRRELTRLPAPVGDRWLAVLDDLERLRDGLAAARGCTQRLAALNALNARFEAATETSALRGEGQTYVGRSIVYEDCRRALSFDLGRPLLERARPALELLFASARAGALEVERRVLKIARACHARLVAATGRAEVDYLRLFTEVKKELPPDTWSDVQRGLQRHWREALAVDQGERRVERRADELAQRLPYGDEPRPRWPHARFHSPDLLIAARSVEAICAGDYLVVLGEIHANENTVNSPLFTKLLDERDAIAAAMGADSPRLTYPVVEDELMFRAASFVFDTGSLVEVEMGRTPSRLPPERVVRVGELSVRERDGELEVRSADGRWTRSLLELLDYSLTIVTSAGLDVIDLGPHSPRVTVEGVVISREKWRLAPPPSDEEDTYLAVHRWAAEHGLPPRFFVKLPEETKPFLVDLANPFLVEQLARLAARAVEIKVSEMLPGPDELWLVDGAGEAYTCELRLVAVERDEPAPLPHATRGGGA